MKLVKFKNDKFGVRIGSWLFGYRFLGDDGFGWAHRANIGRYSQFETLEKAKAIANDYKLKYDVLKEKVK